jgi:hypothetical protein
MILLLIMPIEIAKFHSPNLYDSLVNFHYQGLLSAIYCI